MNRSDNTKQINKYELQEKERINVQSKNQYASWYRYSSLQNSCLIFKCNTPFPLSTMFLISLNSTSIFLCYCFSLCLHRFLKDARGFKSILEYFKSVKGKETGDISEEKKLIKCNIISYNKKL